MISHEQYILVYFPCPFIVVNMIDIMISYYDGDIAIISI